MSEHTPNLTAHDIDIYKNGEFHSSNSAKSIMLSWDQKRWDWEISKDAMDQFAALPILDLLDAVNELDALTNKLNSLPATIDLELKISRELEVIPAKINGMDLTFIVDRERRVISLP